MTEEKEKYKKEKKERRMGSSLSCTECILVYENKKINEKEEKWSEEMKNIQNIQNIPKWTCKGMIDYVKVINVVDGDTVDIVRKMGEKYFQFRVRLYGIDTPEKRPPLSQPNRLEEIAASKASSNALTSLLKEVNGLIRIEFVGEDKYGRLLGNVFIKREKEDEYNVNEWMVKKGYAKPYFGGTKGFDTE